MKASVNNNFLSLWLGQFISLIGSALTTFALSVYVFEQTGSASALATIVFCKFFPSIYLSLFAGPMVDLWDRRKLLLWSHTAVGLVSVAIFALFQLDSLNIATLYLLLITAGVFEAFQSLSFQTSVSQFVKKELYDRYNGLISIIESLPKTLGPVLGAILYQSIGLGGVLSIDILSFIVGGIAIFITPFPKLSQKRPNTSLRQHLSFGLRYIFQRAPLRKLQWLFCLTNFFNGILAGLLAAYILIRSQGDVSFLALNTSLGAIGAVVGGMWITSFGLKKHKVEWMLFGIGVSGLIGRVGMGLVEPSLFWPAFLFVRSALNPMIGSAVNSLWQTKVDPAMQGRVFGARRLLGQGSYPLALLFGAALSDHIFNDANVQNLGGYWLHMGPGAGLALLFVFIGALEASVALIASFSRDLREVENRLSDHEFCPDGSSTRLSVNT